MSLAGRGVLITRPRELAAGLAAAVERAGGRAIVFPAIEIEDLPPPAALAHLADYDFAIFISPTAVARALRAGPRWPARLRAAAVGEGTRRELEARGIAGVLAPGGEGDSEALLALPELAAAAVAGRRVAIFRGEGGRALLGDTLVARGAQVDYAECYRRVRPRADASSLVAGWDAVQAATVSSEEALRNLLELLGPEGAQRLRATPLFAGHERVAAAARGLGVREVLVAGPGDAAMLERLVAYFSP